MDDETDTNDRQADVGDAPDLEPVEQVEQSLEQLEENGELDSDRLTFKTKIIGGVHLDQISDILDDVDDDRHPVRITIEPANDIPEDHHYQIKFEDLD